MALLHPIRPATPHLTALHPRTALPGAAFEISGSNLLSAAQLPQPYFGDTLGSFDLARPTRALVRVPNGAISSDLVLRLNGHASNPLHANLAVPMAEDLHIVSNPAVDADGNLFAMVSGPRGESVAVSIFRIARDLQVSPFVRGLLNVSALAFDPHGNLFASSRSEGAIYRISPAGAVATFAEGMGIATGLAFDAAGNLFVGDRSGTIFKLSPAGEIFVFATLEPSVAFYHLCFGPDGVLFVTAPTTSSHQPIYAIDPDGTPTTFFRGLGRPQGMAFDLDGNLYVAASLEGHRGIVRIDANRQADRQAELMVAGNDLVGLCFLDDGCAALATNSTLFHADLGVDGRPLC
jgi:glucose/arabinose dehydrogenase